MSEKYAILGYPLKHTMSPPIHEKLFALSGKNAEYEIMEIPPENLNKQKDTLRSLNGFNITIPHKISIIDFMDKLDASAERYHSVNCAVNKNGILTGYNTDCIGFLRALEAEGLSLENKVLQIGCGGVGRMIAIETVSHGGELTIAVRNEDYQSALKTAAEIRNNYKNSSVNVVGISEIKGSFGLLINATPVGMYPDANACPAEEKVISECGSIFDVIYNPVKTKLMSIAENLGKKVVGGMAMLVWQAVVAHEIWDGSAYNDHDISEIIADMEKQVERNFR